MDKLPTAPVVGACSYVIEKEIKKGSFPMSKEHAHRILDGVKAGVRYPTHIITYALHVTGDL